MCYNFIFFLYITFLTSSLIIGPIFYLLKFLYTHHQSIPISLEDLFFQYV